MRKSFFYRQKNLDAIFFAVLGFLMVIFYTRYSGIGVSPDSIAYTSVARNLNTGLGMVEFDRKPMVEFPLIFPIFLGMIMFISRLDPIITAPYIIGFLFASLLFLSSRLINTFNYKSNWYKCIILVSILLSPSLLEVYTYLWSETLFILLTILFLLSWKRYGNLHQQKWLLISSIIASIACVTRFAGITLIGTGTILLLFDPSLKISQKIKNGCLFISISASLLLANLLRNAFILGSLTGNRQKSIASLSQNISYFGIQVSNWFTFPTEDNAIAFWLGLSILTLFIVLFLWRSRNRNQYFSTENSLVAFFLVYALFIVISSSISRYETINSRLLSPAFIPFLVGLTSWTIPFLKNIRQKKHRAIPALLILVMVLFIYRTHKIDHQRYEDERQYGIPGFTDDSWNKAQIVQFLKTNQNFFNPKIQIYSNADYALYFFSVLPCISTPDRHYPKTINAFFSTTKCYLVQFDQIDEPDLLNLREIGFHKKIVLIKKFKEGTIYFCTAVSRKNSNQ